MYFTLKVRHEFLVSSLSCVFVCSSNDENVDGGVDCDVFFTDDFSIVMNGCKLVCDVNVICLYLDTVAYCL